MTTPCPVCGSAEAGAVAPYRGLHPPFLGLARASCRQCGMVFASPMPDDASVDAFNAAYFANAHGGMPADPVTRAFHSAINRLRVAHVEQYLADRRVDVSAVLEVGPGGGHFARHWLQRHPGSRYWAIESDTSCIPELTRLGITALRPGEEDAQAQRVDLIVLSHVLEHTTSPQSFLGRLIEHLRPGGTVFIEVPCRDWEHKTEDEPHLLFFDRSTLEKLLVTLGFADIHCGYYGRTIEGLKRRPLLRKLMETVRARALAVGIVSPLAATMPGLEVLDTPLERAAVRPYEAHRQQQTPAWWLRVVARLPQVDVQPRSTGSG